LGVLFILPQSIIVLRKLVALALAVFTLYTAAFGVFPDMIQRGTHLALVQGLIFSRTTQYCG